MTAEQEEWRHWPLPEAGTSLRKWQAGRCAWCGYEDRLLRDHCHQTGLIRGLLCAACNQHEADHWHREWDAWRNGDHAANAIRHFEVYVGTTGATPIHSSSPLRLYTSTERAAWWAQAEVDYRAGGEWPVEPPWSDAAVARRDAEEEQTRAAFARIAAHFGGVA